MGELDAVPRLGLLSCLFTHVFEDSYTTAWLVNYCVLPPEDNLCFYYVYDSPFSMLFSVGLMPI